MVICTSTLLEFYEISHDITKDYCRYPNCFSCLLTVRLLYNAQINLCCEVWKNIIRCSLFIYQRNVWNMCADREGGGGADCSAYIKSYTKWVRFNCGRYIRDSNFLVHLVCFKCTEYMWSEILSVSVYFWATQSNIFTSHCWGLSKLSLRVGRPGAVMFYY